MREILNINDNWFFTKELASGDSFNSIDINAMERVTLPHTWNNFDGQDGGDDYYRGLCTYQKELFIDDSLRDKKIFIEFGAVNSTCQVLLNGKFVGGHEGGYSAFRFDITKDINWCGNNIITVKVDNGENKKVYPLMADFTFFGGIYRDVNIIAVENTHFDLMDYGSTGIYITPKLENNSAEVTAQARVVNPEGRETVYTIIDAEGNRITSQTVQASVAKVVLKVKDPVLWNGVENPYLYSLIAQIREDNEIIDEIIIPFGIRYFNIDAEEGFFLNGKKYALKGVCRHQDREDMGWAITKKEHKEDIELIKEIGASSIRLAHYQHDQYFYDLCDENGFIVWAEISFISTMSEERQAHQNARSQMLELIKQNYNHPSICFWGLQNEVAIGGESNKLYDNVRDLNRLVKELDSTRLTTSANLFYVDNGSPLNFISDVVSYNLYLGWYNGEINDFDKWIETFHKENPQVPLGMSEYGCDAVLKYHTEKPERQDYTEEFQAYYHEKVWEIFNSKKFLWSTYIWNMFDFASDTRNEGGVKGRNNKGLITFDRAVKKDSFYFYKAQWSTEKFVHICSKRFVERVGETTNIKVYSNCDEITLWVNGEKLGTKKSHKKIFMFENVAINMGENLIVAESSCGYVDESKIIRVEQANQNYVYVNENPRRNRVIHWFENGTTEEQIFPKDCYSVRDKVGVIFDNPEARCIIESYVGEAFDNPRAKALMGMTLERVLILIRGELSDDTFKEINSKLSKIKKV